MSTNFPTSLDTLTNPTSTDPVTNPDHAGQHANANDAIEALEAKVGINSSLVTTSLDFKISSFVPGLISAYAGSSAPTGWLLCDGTAVSRATYSTLFALISTTYGAGNGSTTFNVPNLKGKIPVGLDAAQTEFNTLAETGGSNTHTLTLAESPAHRHGVNITNGSGGAYQQIAITTVGNSEAYSNGGGGSAQPFIESKGGDGAHNNLQPYLVINYIIKY